MPWLRGLLGDLIQYDPHTLKLINPTSQPKETIMDATTGVKSVSFSDVSDRLNVLASSAENQAGAVEALAAKHFGIAVEGRTASEKNPQAASTLDLHYETVNRIEAVLYRIAESVALMNARA